MKKYDYVLVGSGLYAGVWAYEARKRGRQCLVVEKRDHIGGNVYCEDMEGIHVHRYGAHILPVTGRYGIMSMGWQSLTVIPTVLWPIIREKCIICPLI